MEFQNDFSKLQTPRKHLVFKFLVIGDYGVGKTAIVRRYTEGKFSSNYKITIGADFSVKTVQWDANTRVSLQLWDVAGHERFGSMTRVYYKHAIGCAIVFDITRYSSFQSVPKWLSDVRDKVALNDAGEIPIILLANKWDIGENCLSNEAISKFATQNGFKAWFNTSAKTNLNIDEAINCLIDGATIITKDDKTLSSSNTIAISSIEHKNTVTDRIKCCT
ncbi:ras-related protein Rab-38-like [Rhodnius prolixus]